MSKGMYKVVVGSLLVLILVLAGCVKSLPDSDDLSNLEGKHLLYFWTASCSFCVQKLPDLAILQDQLPEDVTMILVNKNDSQSRLEPLLADYPNLNVYLNGASVFTRFGVRHVPTYVFIDSGGETHYTHIGAMTNEKVLAELNNLN